MSSSLPSPNQWSADSNYARIRDDRDPYRQHSIQEANSRRLDSVQLEPAMQSNYYYGEKTHSGIHLDDLSPSVACGMTSPPEKHKTYNYDPFEVSPMEAWQEIKNYNLRIHGLPTLDQMLHISKRSNQPTPSPITESLFKDFLRRLGAHHNLEFLDELEAHHTMWLALQKSSQRNSRASRDRPTPQHMSGALPLSPPGHFSTYTDTVDTIDLLRPLTSPRQRILPDDDDASYYVQHYASRTPQDALSRDDLVKKAKRIHRTFCSPDAACPIHLPDDYRQALEILIEHHGRPEPVVFGSAHAHVMECLNVFYYPRFLDTILYTNTCTATQRILLGFGSLILSAAFAIEFALIFLGTGSTGTRWVAFPFFLIGWSAFITSFSRFAWWLAVVNKIETRFMVYEPIEDMTVKKIHRKQAFLWLLTTLFITFISTIIFVFIPANKLQAP